MKNMDCSLYVLTIQAVLPIVVYRSILLAENVIFGALYKKQSLTKGTRHPTEEFVEHSTFLVGTPFPDCAPYAVQLFVRICTPS